MLNQTNHDAETFAFGVIIPPSTADALRRTPPDVARLCVSCGAFTPQAPGQPLRWCIDGLCLRCYLTTASAFFASKQESAPMQSSIAYLPDHLADDESVPLKIRLLVDLQRRGGFPEWTAPLSSTDLARAYRVARSSISHALRWGIDHGYLEKQFASLPHGGRGARYRVLLERTPAMRGQQ